MTHATNTTSNIRANAAEIVKNTANAGFLN